MRCRRCMVKKLCFELVCHLVSNPVASIGGREGDICTPHWWLAFNLDLIVFSVNLCCSGRWFNINALETLDGTSVFGKTNRRGKDQQG